MYWKLRIPLLLLVFGITAGFCQKYPTLFLANVSNFVASAVYIGLVAVIILILERTGINEKKVHFLFAILLISVGYLFDSWMA